MLNSADCLEEFHVGLAFTPACTQQDACFGFFLNTYSTITMFPDVSLWTGELGAACGAIWWAACWIFPWFLWSVTGWCGRWWSRTCWCSSRNPLRISCWWGRSPEPWLLLYTLQGSVSASNHHLPLKNTHTHTFMHFISHLECYVFNLILAVWTLKH